MATLEQATANNISFGFGFQGHPLDTAHSKISNRPYSSALSQMSSGHGQLHDLITYCKTSRLLSRFDTAAELIFLRSNSNGKLFPLSHSNMRRFP